MSFATRADLLAAVAAELDRDDLASQIPGFLVLAEADINGDTEPRDAVTRATFTADEDYENLPAGFQTPLAIHINGVDGRVRLTYRTPDAIAALREQNLTGTPRYYTIIGTQFWFDRTPGGEQLEIDYYTGIPALTASTDTNTVLAAFPSLYFYGTLLHSAPFLKDDERIALWQRLYDKAMTAFTHRTNRAKFGAGPILARSRRHFP